MKDFNSFSDTHEKEKLSLDEASFSAFKRFFSNSIKKTVARARSILSKLRLGKTARINFSIPKLVVEEQQIGKVGGEMAEVACLDKLYELLNKSGFEVTFRNEAGATISYNTWKTQVYKKNEEEFHKSEAKKNNKLKKIEVWRAHGHASGQLLYQQFKKNLGKKFSPSLTEFSLQHLGQSMSGISKADFAVYVKHKDANEILKNFSMKATESGGPYKTPTQGLNAGYTSIVVSIVSGGKYSTNFVKSLDEYGGLRSLTRKANKLKEAKESGADRSTRIKLAKEVEEAYQGTYLAWLDEEGKKLGYGELGLGRYVSELRDYFNNFKSAGGKKHGSKDGRRVAAFSAKVDDYINVLRDLIDSKLKGKDKEEIIDGIMRLGGLEPNLYYIAAGVDPKDPEASLAISTLSSSGYQKKLDELFGKEALDARTLKTKSGDLFFIVSNRNTKRDIVSFQIYKSHQDTRIELPYFAPEDEEFDLGKEDGTGLLKKFAAIEDMPKPDQVYRGEVGYRSDKDRIADEKKAEEELSAKLRKTLDKNSGQGSFASIENNGLSNSKPASQQNKTIDFIRSAQESNPDNETLKELKREMEEIVDKLNDITFDKLPKLKERAESANSEELQDIISNEIPTLKDLQDNMMSELSGDGELRSRYKSEIDSIMSELKRKKEEEKEFERLRKEEERAITRERKKLAREQEKERQRAIKGKTRPSPPRITQKRIKTGSMNDLKKELGVPKLQAIRSALPKESHKEFMDDLNRNPSMTPDKFKQKYGI